MLPDDEIDALVTRIALFPDPLLAAVLQASTLPLQIVEADRFLARKAKDPNAVRKPEWDSSITALLNYESVVTMMSDDLDWTQMLGAAVLDQLSDVQHSIQQFRAEVHAAGLLTSDDKQVVTAEGETIRIMPAQPQVIYVPMYDGPALAAAIAARPPSEDVAPVTGAIAPGSDAPASSSTAAPPEAVPAGAGAAPTVAAGGSTLVYPPAYPPPSYSQPYPSFWTPGAAFVGGALVGGLLGYAIGDDDDDDIEVYHHGYGGGGRNVSGNKVVSGNTVNVVQPNRRETNNQTQAVLRERGGQSAARTAQAHSARPEIGQAGAARPGAAPEGARATSTQRSTSTGISQPRTRPAQQAGAAPSRRSGSAFDASGSGRDAWRESARGAQSRSAAQTRVVSPGAQRPPSASAARERPHREASSGAMQQRRESGGAFSNQSSGGRAAQQSNRGAKSGAARGGGGGGGGRRR